MRQGLSQLLCSGGANVYGLPLQTPDCPAVIPMRHLALVLCIASLGLGAGAALAQLVLPGAQPAAPRAAAKPRPAKAAAGKPDAAARRAAPVKAPSEETIIGRELLLNGKSGRISFSRSGTDLAVSRLTLEGSQISRPDDSCRVDVVAGTPLAASAQGRPQGMQRYQLAIEACPFVFDVLDGAILAAPLERICEIKAADCQVNPAGLWGPRAAALGPERSKEIERARTHAESAMRESFKALLAAAQGKPATKAVAGEQAGFSSTRSIICRDYAGEDKHGFCALRLTEARALTLRAAIGQGSEEGAVAKKPRPGKR